MTTQANSMRAMHATGQLAGQLAEEGPIGLSIFEVVRTIGRELFPRNTAAELAVPAGYSGGNMERILNRKRRMSAEHALRLFTSGIDQGRMLEAYVESLPEEKRERAWAAIGAAVRRVELREGLKRQQAELEELERRALARGINGSGGR